MNGTEIFAVVALPTMWIMSILFAMLARTTIEGIGQIRVILENEEKYQVEPELREILRFGYVRLAHTAYLTSLVAVLVFSLSGTGILIGLSYTMGQVSFSKGFIVHGIMYLIFGLISGGILAVCYRSHLSFAKKHELMMPYSFRLRQ
jgi:hypothetical protein